VNVLLRGIVGSTAYGLAGPGSDIDRLGVFAVPTIELHGLHPPRETFATTNPDLTLHEAAKACRLLLTANPTVTDILWLPDDLYEVRTPLGVELIGIRTAFLSATRIRAAYLGYADQQFRRLAGRPDGTFSADTRRRTSKHARHLMRLCHQGFTLYATGQLMIRLDDPEAFREFGERVAGGDIGAARQLIASYATKFEEATPAVPERPDEPVVESWLRAVRTESL
jgi:hypothetical protein